MFDQTSKFVSPNEMLAQAKTAMLEGKEPQSRDDWVLIMNFFAMNVHPDVALLACRLIAKLYDMPLSEGEVEQIVNFQINSKAGVLSRD